MFIPSLEGTVGPKRKASVSVPDTSHLEAELARLRREVERLEQENLQALERVSCIDDDVFVSVWVWCAHACQLC